MLKIIATVPQQDKYQILRKYEMTRKWKPYCVFEKLCHLGLQTTKQFTQTDEAIDFQAH